MAITTLFQAFDPSQVDPEQFASFLPPGRHKVIIESTELLKTQKNGAFIKVVVSCIEGEHAGATASDNLNIVNDSPKTVAIAHGQLSAICHAVGKTGVLTDTRELWNIPLFVDVIHQDGGDGKVYSKIKKYYDANGNIPSRRTSVPQPPQAAPRQPQQAPQGQQAAPPAAWGGGQPTQAPQQPPQPPAGWGQPQQPPQAPPAAWGQQAAPQAPQGWNGPPAGGAPQPPPAWATQPKG